MQQASRLQYRFLPARASVGSGAVQALRMASEHAAADLPAHRRSSSPEEQAAPVALILHPRDARQLRLRALALGGAERMAALRSQLEACLLEDVQDLVIAARFESDGWVAGLANRSWIEKILAAANEQGQRAVGIWSAQAYAAALAQGGGAADAGRDMGKPAGRDAGKPAGGEAGTSAGRETGSESEPRSDQWDWPPRERVVGVLDPSMNLLEAMLLHRGEDSWAGLRGDRWWSPRGLRLALAKTRWSLETMPAQAWRQPFAALLAAALLAGFALQADTLRMRAELEEREAEVARLFREMVPGTQAMVDPVIQAQRVLEQWRRNPSALTDAQPDPLAGLVMAHTALSRAGGSGAVEAVRAIEWKGREGSSGGILTVRWKPGALDLSTLRPVTQELAARAAWTVQWGGSSESMMQWRAPAAESTRR